MHSHNAMLFPLYISWFGLNAQCVIFAARYLARSVESLESTPAIYHENPYVLVCVLWDCVCNLENTTKVFSFRHLNVISVFVVEARRWHLILLQG